MTNIQEMLLRKRDKDNKETVDGQKSNIGSILYFLIIVGCSILAFYLNYTKNSRCFSSNQMNVLEKIVRAFFAGLMNIAYLVYHFIVVRPYSLRGSCMYGGYARVR